MMKVIDLLLKAIKENEFNEFLRGDNYYELQRPYMSPTELPTDWDLILKEGIYKYFREKPNDNIDNRFEKALTEIMFDVKGIYCTLNLFWNYLMDETYKSAPFKIKKDKIIQTLSEELKKHRNEFIMDKRWAGQ
jgi:hypothetical protein